jgi:hypothetical protein
MVLVVQTYLAVLEPMPGPWYVIRVVLVALVQVAYLILGFLTMAALDPSIGALNWGGVNGWYATFLCTLTTVRRGLPRAR